MECLLCARYWGEHRATRHIKLTYIHSLVQRHLLNLSLLNYFSESWSYCFYVSKSTQSNRNLFHLTGRAWVFPIRFHQLTLGEASGEVQRSGLPRTPSEPVSRNSHQAKPKTIRLPGTQWQHRMLRPSQEASFLFSPNTGLPPRLLIKSMSAELVSKLRTGFKEGEESPLIPVMSPI